MKDFISFINNKKDQDQPSINENIINEDELNYGGVANSADLETLWNTLNPETGMRFEIPMLKFMDNDYKLKYIEYMKMRQDDPEAFERVLQWN